MKKRYAGAILGITLGTMSVGSAYLPAAQMMAMAAESSTAESDTEETETDGDSTEEATAASDDKETETSTKADSAKPDGEQPPEKPDGYSTDGQEPPAKPDGDTADGEQPPEKPDGEAPSGEAPSGEAPDGQGGPGGENGEAPGGQGGPGGNSGAPGQGGPGGVSGVDSYDAVTEYTEDATSEGESFSSTGTDENAVLVSDGANVSISGAQADRSSGDSTGGDNSSFYGVGAAMLVTDGTLTVSDSTITSDAKGGAGVFAYGDGTAYVMDSKITTTQDTSGGIHAAGGGTLYAWDLDVETSGESSAAIRSDRGGGKMVVDGGTYTSNGTGSPAVYSTADIAVNNATLTANGSEAVCIEGLNSLRLYNCDLTGNMSDLDQNDCTWNVILYQSMSGDSEVGNSTFEMNGGTLTAKNGGMFYTTNTESTFTLSNVDITYAEDSEFFLKCTGNSNARGWGETGKNGADCTFTGISQEMNGDVVWDSISDLDFYVTDGSTLTGAVVDDESKAGEGGDGYCSLYVDEVSSWVVTGDSTVTNLYAAGDIVDADGNTVTIIGTDGTIYVQGDSEYTITTETYSGSVDLSGASALSAWSDYEVEKPEA